ncbi:MAG: amidohydrolase [Acidobacteria bacterium]|nr:amidohydrolase [Acidobacteriota bacterium]
MPAETPPAPSVPSAGSLSDLAGRAEADYPYLLNLYRELHAAPELSGQEVKTAARMASELETAGFAVTRGVGGHGVVGVLRNGEGPVLMLRTDMDALPVPDETGLPFASAVKARDDAGRDVCVNHACGHDLHMTVFVGTARALSGLRDRWKGTLLLVAQPAEEVGRGARAMLGAGLFTRFPRPDAALALHVCPESPVGTVSVAGGYVFAGVDSADVRLFGRGGHGAAPHTAVDPVVLAAQVVLAFQTVVSRERDPVEPVVLTVGSIQGGTAHNIIPDEVLLRLTLRTYAPEARTRAMESIRRICRGIALAGGVPDDRLPRVIFLDNTLPSLHNDPALVRRVVKAFLGAFGPDAIRPQKPEMIGEDFAFYGRTEPPVPICMFRLGTATATVPPPGASGPPPGLHSPRFRPDPSAIRTGVTAMTAAALEVLGPGAGKPRMNADGHGSGKSGF